MNTADPRETPRLGRSLGALTDSEADGFEDTAAMILAALAPSQAATPALRASLLGKLDSVPQAPSTPTLAPTPEPFAAPAAAASFARVTPLRRTPTRLRRGLVAVAGLAAAAALVVAGVAGSTVLHPQHAVDASSVLESVSAAHDAGRASTSFDAGSARVTVLSSASVGRSVAIVDNAPAVAAGRTYELWYIRDGHATPAGTFTPSSSRMTVTLAGRFLAHDVVAATVEPAGGSARPTTPPVFELPA